MKILVLLEQVEAVIYKLYGLCSRSSVENFRGPIHRYPNRELLEQINQDCESVSDSNEQGYLTQMRHQHRRIVEGEW